MSQGDQASIDHLVHNMIYASAAKEYDENRASLEKLCKRLDYGPFFEYFVRNWDALQDMWVMYRRARLPHFKKHTNNRLESCFRKFKDGVSGSTSMVTCVELVVAAARRREKEYLYRKLRVGRFTNVGYDEEMSKTLRVMMWVTTSGGRNVFREWERVTG